MAIAEKGREETMSLATTPDGILCSSHGIFKNMVFCPVCANHEEIRQVREEIEVSEGLAGDPPEDDGREIRADLKDVLIGENSYVLTFKGKCEDLPGGREMLLKLKCNVEKYRIILFI